MYVVPTQSANLGNNSMKPINHQDQTQITESLLASQGYFIFKSYIKADSNNPSSIPLLMHKTKVRFFALAMAALLMFGNNYSFDNPQALQSQIMLDLSISSPQYNLLYSAFSFPNIFLTLAGGVIIDLVGVRFGIFCFCSGVLIAQLVVALGGTFKIYSIMLTGRAVFGVCSENLVIAQSAIVSKWFKGSELSMAIGIIMTVPELASAINSLISPMLYQSSGSLTLPLFVSVGICALSLICAIVLVYLDKRADLQQQETELNIKTGQHEKVSFDDIKQFSATFWILVLICMFILGVYVPFLDDANDFFQKKFEFSSVQAGRVLMIPYLTSIFMSLVIGRFVDRVGKRRYLILVTAGLYIISHTLFGILGAGNEGNPNYWSIFPLIVFGTAYASYSCVIIPCVQYVVQQRVMGTAFGIMGMFESIALAMFPIIAASIVTTSENDSKGYSNVGFFYSGIASIALILASSLFFFDQKASMFLDFINPEIPNNQEQLIINKYKKSIYSENDDEDDDEDDYEDENNYTESEQDISETDSLQKSQSAFQPKEEIKFQANKYLNPIGGIQGKRCQSENGVLFKRQVLQSGVL